MIGEMVSPICFCRFKAQQTLREPVPRKSGVGAVIVGYDLLHVCEYFEDAEFANLDAEIYRNTSSKFERQKSMSSLGKTKQRISTSVEAQRT